MAEITEKGADEEARLNDMSTVKIISELVSDISEKTRKCDEDAYINMCMTLYRETKTSFPETSIPAELGWLYAGLNISAIHVPDNVEDKEIADALVSKFKCLEETITKKMNSIELANAEKRQGYLDQIKEL